MAFINLAEIFGNRENLVVDGDCLWLPVSEQSTNHPLAVLERKQQKSNGGNIPIRKIFVRNVPLSIDRNTIKKNFENYGFVVHVDLPLDENKVRRSYVFVTFHDPKSADMAIKKHQIFIHNHRLFVHAADQWHQPLELPDGSIQWFRGETHRSLEEINLPEVTSSQTSECQESEDGINKVLNDDCLRCIFSHLSLRELIGIERVCRRWRNICLGIWQTVPSLDFKKKFKVKRNIKLRTDYFRELLLRCGDRITSLDISNVMSDMAQERILPLISKYCKNLMSLNVSGMKLYYHEPFITNVATNLKCLFLNGLFTPKDKLFVQILESAKQLELLSVAGSELSASKLNCLSDTCKILNVSSCQIKKENDFKEVLKRLTRLEKLYASSVNFSFDTYRSVGSTLTFLRCSVEANKGNLTSPAFGQLKCLDIHGAYAIDDKFLLRMVAECPALEKLKITRFTPISIFESIIMTSSSNLTEKGLKSLSGLTKLVSLCLSHCPSVTSKVVEYLADNSRGRYEQVELVFCKNLTDSGPTRLITVSHKLKYLNLLGCEKVTSDLLSSAVSALNLRTNKLPLEMYLYGTAVNYADIETDKHSLLTIGLDPKSPTSSDYFEERLSDIVDWDNHCQPIMIPEGGFDFEDNGWDFEDQLGMYFDDSDEDDEDDEDDFDEMVGDGVDVNVDLWTDDDDEDDFYFGDPDENFFNFYNFLNL